VETDRNGTLQRFNFVKLFTATVPRNPAFFAGLPLFTLLNSPPLVAGSSIGLGKQLVFVSFLRPQSSRIGWSINLFRTGPERTV
jgi:hypothetical protein